MLLLGLNLHDDFHLSVKEVWGGAYPLLFFFYVVTAKYFMQQKFMQAFTVEEFREWLVRNGKFRFPYTAIYFLPHVLGLSLLLYVYVVTVPNALNRP